MISIYDRVSCLFALAWPNDPVHRAAAWEFPFQSRPARGSVCNGLLFGILRSQLAPALINAQITDLCFRFRACCRGVRP